jgi:hypothetical protein
MPLPSSHCPVVLPDIAVIPKASDTVSISCAKNVYDIYQLITMILRRCKRICAPL